MSTLATLILAAGQGTRMKSQRAKVLHELAGEPMIYEPVRLGIQLHSEPVVVVVGHQADAVEAAVQTAFPGKAQFALQREQRGTGHAVMEGMKLVPDHVQRVLILYGDVPLLRRSTLEALLETEGQTKGLALITAELDEPKGYGRIVRDADTGRVMRIVEEKDATPEIRRIREVNAGIYAVNADFLRRALTQLKDNNAQREYYLTDLVSIAIAENRQVETVLVPDASEVQGINSRAQLAEIGAVLRKRIAQKLSDEGVTVVDPTTTYIARDVSIGADTIVEPGVHIRGRTTIGRGCHIDVGSVLTNATIEDDVTVHPYSVIEDAVVRAQARIGPFSRLRPGAEILEHAHVGNFVELKKTKLGKGSKANHLAYLGDSEIGQDANIGAGTITCNYDGYGKYATKIGDGVFIGSNATLVAPLTIEKDAYVAAGSTITERVEKSDLAFGRARQINKAGRADALRDEAKTRAGKKK